MAFKKHQLPMRELNERIHALEQRAEARNPPEPEPLPIIEFAPFDATQVPTLAQRRYLRDKHQREWFTLHLGTPGGQ